MKIKTQDKINIFLIATVLLLALAVFVRTSSGSDKANGAYQPTMAGSQIVTDSTHEFDTDAQQAAWTAKQAALPTGGTSEQYIGGDFSLQNFPVSVSSTYQSLITQTGTSAPTGTALHNDFGATTFTWARTGAGVYTLTASAPTFTANKTGVFMSNPNNTFAGFKYTVTSTTVITFTTTLEAILSLALTNPATDALFANTMIDVVVYP